MKKIELEVNKGDFEIQNAEPYNPNMKKEMKEEMQKRGLKSTNYESEEERKKIVEARNAAWNRYRKKK